MTIALPRFHMPGETLSGHDFSIFFGGKGGNQAVALAMLEKHPAMVAMVGDDAHGVDYIDELKSRGVSAEYVNVMKGTHTGVALIDIVESTGENRIALAPGANALFTSEVIEPILSALVQFDIFLLQLEIPMETNRAALRFLKAQGKTVVLDPAPAAPLAEEDLKSIDYLTPNETELLNLTGMPVETFEQIEAAARSLIARGANSIIVKMGARGAMLVNNTASTVAPFSVKVVDTTAAGDAFNAGFAGALAEGMSELNSVKFANATAALATTGYGAQSAMPRLSAVQSLINGWK